MEKQETFLKLKSKITKSKKSGDWEIFVDGASRGNPGVAGAGIFIIHNKKEVLKEGIFLGQKTNNQAEYLALALALFFLKNKLLKKEKTYTKIIVTSDSELLVKQMNRLYKVKNPVLFQIKELIDSMIKNVSCQFKHVLRSKNKIADALANLGIEGKKSIPKNFIKLLNKYNLEV